MQRLVWRLEILPFEWQFSAQFLEPHLLSYLHKPWNWTRSGAPACDAFGSFVALPDETYTRYPKYPPQIKTMLHIEKVWNHRGLAPPLPTCHHVWKWGTKHWAHWFVPVWCLGRFALRNVQGSEGASTSKRNTQVGCIVIGSRMFATVSVCRWDHRKA